MISYAQNFEDVLLWRAFGDIRDGAYIDVGACHATEGSVTRWFYDHGWAGVNLEPIPELYAALERERRRDINIQAAAGAAPGRAEFRIVRQNLGYSSLVTEGALPGQLAEGSETVAVEVITLDSVFARLDRPVVHFLKIDVEGAEAAVLAGLDLRRNRPRVMVIEATAPGSPQDVSDAWRPGVEGAGYRHAWFDGLNRWFVAEEHAGLIPRIALPPNVFDDFIPLGLHQMTERVIRAEAAAQHAQDAFRGLEVRLGEAQAQRAEAEGRAAAAAEQLAAATAQVEAMKASTSWRMTAPLRALRGV